MGAFIVTKVSVIKTILLLTVFIVGFAGSSFATQGELKRLTTADLQKLRWIEGTWRGSGVNQPSFFERYRFESDSVLVVDNFADDQLSKVTETTRFELKDGEFGGGSEGARYAAGALDDSSITFLPVLKVRNSFVWKRETKDTWTAIIRWPATNDKPARERIYNMVRMK